VSETMLHIHHVHMPCSMGRPIWMSGRLRREAWRGWAEFAVIAEVLSPSTSSCDNGIPGSLNLTASPTSPSFFGFDVGISSFWPWIMRHNMTFFHLP
jgi:hypothetical protein